MTIAARLVAILFTVGSLVAPAWASEESSPHATETHHPAGEPSAHGEGQGHGGHKALRHDANDIYKDAGKDTIDAGKLFNTLKDHATEDTYELHIVSSHLALPIMFTDNHGFHFFG